MSEGIIGLETLDDIGRAIQYVEDSEDQYTPGQMAEAIERMKRTIIPMTFSANGEYDAILDDADGYNPVKVQVPQPSGTVNISQNGTTDVTQYATANVQVPNTYTAADEGKVVQSGALVAQTSRTVTQNGTVDTTLNNSVNVAVQPNLQAKTTSQNGTVTPDSGYDGLSQVIVNVSGGTTQYTISVTGGVGGGAVIAVSINDTQIFTATGSSPSNLSYTPSSGSYTIGTVTWQVSVTPPQDTQGDLYVSLSDGDYEEEVSFTFSGSSTADGYNDTETGVWGGSSAVIQPLTVNQNGTYNPPAGVDGYAPVTVQVSGGGGDVPLLTKAQWDALTTAQKQAYGLVAIQNANSGFSRGELVYGAEYSDLKKYLPNSDEDTIVCAAAPEDYSSSLTSWGKGTHPVQLSAAGSAQNADGSVAINVLSNGTLAWVDLSVNSTTFTAYIVAKITRANGGYTRIISAMESRQSSKGIMLFGNTDVIVSKWGTYFSTGVNPTNYFVGVIQFSGIGSAKGSAISGPSTPVFKQESPTSAGRYVTIGRTDIDASTYNAEPTDMDVLFVGVVRAAESETIMSANMVYLAQKFLGE